MEHLVRRPEAKGFAGPVVEAIHRLLPLRVGCLAEAGLLREILPHQPVGVLVRTALPGGVRVGEIEVRPQHRRHPSVRGELGAVVGGQGEDRYFIVSKNYC